MWQIYTCRRLPAPALVLNVGAGNGRDAAWLAGLGHYVVAVEPAPAMRAEAMRRHTGIAIRWMADQRPALPATLRLGLAFDLILASAGWQHVLPADRPRALRKLLGLLRALCRAADGQAGLVASEDDDTVVLPLGLVALDWLRLHLPLVVAKLPQMPRNAGPDGLGFAGPGSSCASARILAARPPSPSKRPSRKPPISSPRCQPPT